MPPYGVPYGGKYAARSKFYIRSVKAMMLRGIPTTCYFSPGIFHKVWSVCRSFSERSESGFPRYSL